MMSDLPADLVKEILCRVPAKSVTRLRSVCKRWNALFKNRGFTERQFRKAAKESLILMLKDRRVCSLSVILNVVAPSVEFKSALGLEDSYFDSKQSRIATVFHCDGLLLCTSTIIDDRLVVWNPCLGETKWINHKTDSMGNSDFALGYQTNKSCRSYKILRCRNCYNYNNDEHFVAFEIYELSSDSWRVLDNVALNCSIKRNTGVSLMGNSYWLTSDYETKFLLSFDFTTERSKRLYLPPNLDFCRILLSVVREEQLSVLFQNFHTKKMEIWMTNNIDTEASLLWRKSFTVDLKIHTTVGYFPTCRSFLISEGKKKVCLCSDYLNNKNMVYIIGVDNDQNYTEISYEESTMLDHPIIFSYVPSLVQI